MNLSVFFNKAIGKIGRLLYESNHVNWLATIYFNLRQLSLRTAVKLPIYIYFDTKLVDLSGRIVINGEIRRGIVKIGKKWTRSQGNTYYQNRGIWVIHGASTICKGTQLLIMPKACFETGENVNIREHCYISVNKRVKLGRNCELAYSCQIMDSDFHYTINTETRETHYMKGDIIIGDNNWFGSYTTVKKGTKTPNNCIVASSFSLLCKDYTKSIPENSVIGGIPAKLISRNSRRIYNMKSHQQIANHYLHSDEVFRLSIEDNMNEFCE